MITRIQRITRVAIGAAFAVAALALPAGASAVTPVIHFEIYMFQTCFDGWASDYSMASVVWRDSAGALKIQGTMATSEYGFYQLCSGNPDIYVEPGDRIRVSDGVYTRKFTVPNLTLQLDRITDLATGTGPHNRTVRICSNWSEFFYGHGPMCRGVRVGDDGNWSYDPPVDIVGGIAAQVTWRSPNDDLTHAEATAPYVSVTLDKAAFRGGTAPAVEIDLAIDGVKDSAAHVKADGLGGFSGQFRDAQNRLAAVRAGDHITSPNLASDEDWIMPDIDVAVDKVTDVVSGVCEDTGTSSHRVVVDVSRNGQRQNGAIVGTDSDGSFAVDFKDLPPFGSSFNIRRGDRISITCMQTTGDRAQLKLSVP
jgi:hypothetical protein